MTEWEIKYRELAGAVWAESEEEYLVADYDHLETLIEAENDVRLANEFKHLSKKEK